MVIIIDLFLIFLLLATAILAVFQSKLFNAVAYYIGFGLVMAIVWVRLKAPDIAMAEVALGAGITGAMLFGALARIAPEEVSFLRSKSSVPLVVYPLLSILIVSLLVVIIWVLAQFPKAHESAIDVAGNLSRAGVKNPVTAVLVNFRAYDTFLEMGVLFLALVGVSSLKPMKQMTSSVENPLVKILLISLLPLLIILAVYLLWAGADYPGGAFQAGAVLAGGGVLSLIATGRSSINLAHFSARVLVVIGLAVFLIMGLYLMILGDEFLQFSKPKLQILIIEVACMLSIAAILSALLDFGRAEEVSNGEH